MPCGYSCARCPIRPGASLKIVRARKVYDTIGGQIGIFQSRNYATHCGRSRRCNVAIGSQTGILKVPNYSSHELSWPNDILSYSVSQSVSHSLINICRDVTGGMRVESIVGAVRVVDRQFRCVRVCYTLNRRPESGVQSWDLLSCVVAQLYARSHLRPIWGE